MRKKVTQIFTLIAGLAFASPSIYAQDDCAADGGTISTESPTMFITNNGEPDMVEVTRVGMNENLFLAWVITSDDTDPAIIDLYTSLDMSSFNFEGYAAGTYNIWSMSVDPEASNINDALGSFPVSTVYLSDFAGCWALSNALTIIATHEGSEPVEDGCYASEIVNFSQGVQMNGNPVAANRSNPEMALGQPDASNAVGGFVSLGVGGSITLGFDGNIMDGPGNDLRIFETSFSGDICGNSDDEFADIEVSQDGVDFIYIATICRDEEIDIADAGLDYITQIRITSAEMTSTPDGYDVDGVEAIHGCGPMPVIEGCFAGEVLTYNPGPDDMGNPLTDPNRIDPTKALGAPELDDSNNFVSLGFGGELVLGFEGGVALNGPGVDILISETTFGGETFDSYPESADVYVSQNGVDFFIVGFITTNELGTYDISDAGQGFEYITSVKIVDTTPLEGSESYDGFDVDGIEALNGCGPIPVEEGCFAGEVFAYNPGPDDQGNPLTDPLRIDPTKALGEPELDDTYNFVSLGFGGELILGFEGGVVLNGPGVDISISETTFGGETFASYPESADVFVSQNGVDYFQVGFITTNELGTYDISDAGQGFEYIIAVKIVDTTPLEGSDSYDGFDVDGVEALNGCGPIPDIVPGDCYATEVVSYLEGTTSNGGSIDVIRTDPTQALGEPERTDEYVFVSLGYGGELVLSFDGSIPNLEGDDIEIVETTFGHTTCATYPEFADVYVSENGSDYHFAQTICRDDNFVDISDAGAFTHINYVKIVNNNTLSTSPDAFDVDGVVAIHNCEEGELDGFVQADAMNTVVSAYPNPTAGQVVIEFTPAVSERAMVEIYDMNGRVVETIYNQEVQAGQNYRLDFNGTHLPNGIYIAKFTTDTETVIEKIMMAK